MKIGNSPEKLASTPVGTNNAAEAGRGGAKPAPVAAGGKGPEASAQIQLSSAASSLLAGVPDEGSFDVEKVDRIAQAISEGKFSINADVVADKLIANAQEMLSRATPH